MEDGDGPSIVHPPSSILVFMNYVPLGTSNVRVSRFCLGTMMFGGKTDAGESVRITRRAMDAGINFIDTADVYSESRCESILGEVTGDASVRDQIVLATKAGMVVGKGPNDQGVSRFHYVRAVEASLKRLRTDRIDLYYIHWPMERMNLEETLRTLDDLVRQGKILYAACSNFPAWLVCRSQWIAEVKRYVPLVCGQYPYNLIERGLEVEVLPMAQALGLGITIYRPLAIGVLTAKYLDAKPSDARGEKDDRADRWTKKYADGLRKLAAFAKERGVAPADVANAWVSAHPAVTSVIVGISSLAQLDANLKAADFTLSPQDRELVSNFFPTEVVEESGGKFPGWRRSFDIAMTAPRA
jgi:aryl-alcohol dehydrogenase-like predicted oxidoreductase